MKGCCRIENWKSEKVFEKKGKEDVLGIRGNKRMKKVWLLVAAVLFLFTVSFLCYTSSYYHSETEAEELLYADRGAVSVEKTEYGWFFDGPSTENALIFYPGGKVEETAYAPFLNQLAEGGMDVCLVKMPFRLAVLDMNAAADILPLYDYENWYIGGHSLGGAFAGKYAARHGEEFKGIIFCAAYPTQQLDAGMTEILLYGSEDRVLNLRRVEKSKRFAPESMVEHVIEGGNHAQFGNYGAQSGDGTASVSAWEQQAEAVKVILDTINGGRGSKQGGEE